MASTVLKKNSVLLVVSIFSQQKMCLSKEEMLFLRENAYASQCKRFEIFKSQDVERGHFDVTFDIGGKKLHAHKFILSSVSETFNSWLSPRWSKKDEAVKIEDYSYEIFFEFLCFIYSGECTLTDENVFQVVDTAEFYDVPFLKDYCDEFLTYMTFSVENVEEMFEFAEKYSLTKMKSSLSKFLQNNVKSVSKTEDFLTKSKSFVEFLCTANSRQENEDLFEGVYKWVEHDVTGKSNIGADNSKIQETIKVEFSKILRNFSKYEMDFNFLMNFYLEKGFILSAYEFLFCLRNYRVKFHDENKAFKNVYELAEKQVLKKQQLLQDDNFNLVDSIKAELVQVILHCRFYQMNKSFLDEFVVAKGILSEEEARNVCNTRVEMRSKGKGISGTFTDDYGIRRGFECGGSISLCSARKLRFTNSAFSIPSYPSTLKKIEGVQWYLCFEKSQTLSVKYHSLVDESDYLVAEMKGDAEFQYNNRANISIVFSNNF